MTTTCPHSTNGKHNDRGTQKQRGNKLYTHCTCGAIVAIDDVTIYENGDDE